METVTTEDFLLLILVIYKDGVDLQFSESALMKIAQEAMKRKTGARSLRSIVEDVMNDIMYELPDDEDVDTVWVDVDDENNFKVIKQTEDNRKEVLMHG